MRMSRDTGLKLVATNDIHYTYAEDEKAHDILLCIQTRLRGNKLGIQKNRKEDRGYEGCGYALRYHRGNL